MADSIQVSRGGYQGTITNHGKTAIVELERAAPTGPTDWKAWLEKTFDVRFGHNAQVTKAEPREGKFRVMCRGGARETLSIYDTKPRKVTDGDVLGR